MCKWHQMEMLKQKFYKMQYIVANLIVVWTILAGQSFRYYIYISNAISHSSIGASVS